MDEVKKEEARKNKKHYDRITLLNSNIKVIENLIKQVRGEFPSLYDLQFKDMVNLLIEIRGSELSKNELMQIYKQLFDPIKIMKLATQDLVDAKKKGISISLQDALKKYETPSVIKNQPSSLAQRKSKKNDVNGELNNQKESIVSDSSMSNEAIAYDVKVPMKSSKNQESKVLAEIDNKVEKNEN